MRNLIARPRISWRLIIAIGLLCVAGLGVLVAWAARPLIFPSHAPGAAPVLARVTDVSTPKLGFEQLDISTGWRFRTDSLDRGRAEGWEKAGLDDSAWDTIEAGACWEDFGYPSYDGVGWYRRALIVPDTWQGRSVHLWLDGVDDEFDVFVNDQFLAHHGDSATRKGAWSETIATRVDQHLNFGERNVIAIRVVDWAGDGGLCKLPVTLSTNGETLVSGTDYINRLAALSPDAILPGWARGQDRAWTVTGVPQGPAAAVVGTDGTVAPHASAFNLTWWVYDPATGKVIAPENVPVEQRLQDGYQPTPITIWREDGLEGESTALVSMTSMSSGGGLGQRLRRIIGLAAGNSEPALLYRVRLTSAAEAPRRLVVVVALRPYGPNGPSGQTRWIGSVDGNGDTVRVNGQLALIARTTPAGFGAASLAGRDLSEYVRAGEFPVAGSLTDPQGLATIGLEYPVTVQAGQPLDLTFALPLAPTAPLAPPSSALASASALSDAIRAAAFRALDFDAEALRVRADWQSRLQRVSLNLPDIRYSHAFYASIGYLLANMRGDVITSGPFAHHAMWYRDAAYVLPALYKAGVAGVGPATVERLTKGMMPSGEFPAALEIDGRPRWNERHEWDAQGQYIYIVAESYRMSGDRARLDAAYPTVVRAADFIVELSARSRTSANEGTPLYGLLPPGDSAEDLGPRDQHHYWDDFWAIGGLREAADIARTLGRGDDAIRFDREAATLQTLVLQSIERVQEQHGIDFVPNGPEDTFSSAMARGTSPAVWPLKLFPPDDPLMRRSFEVYDERWVKPQSNGYMHNSGNLWTYGGLEIAHSWMFLGEAGRAAAMTQWVIDNPTAPGTWAWAEAVKPESKRFSGGDMPHSWAAAEYILYLRDALVREDGDRLILADAVPAPWLQDGQRVEIHNAPTYFGTAGYSLVSHASAGYWELTIDEGTKAPGGYVLRGPFPNAPTRLVIDGREVAPSAENRLELPAGARVVRVYFQ